MTGVQTCALPIFCLPALFLLLFHAAVSVSIPRYNLLLLPVLSLAIAQMIAHTYRCLQGRRAFAQAR